MGKLRTVRGARADKPERPATGRLADVVPDGLSAFFTSLDRARRQVYTQVQRIPLGEMENWSAGADHDVIRHASGRFFTIEGMHVQISRAATPRWSQPLINQPEIGILGIVMKQFDGVPQYLMQLKAEPGNNNGIQVSPTVQATKSNYTRVHGGRAVPYLDYFRNRSRDRHRVIFDARQSEQGSWFLQKRNRNMIIEVTEEMEVLPGFHWLTIEQVHQLMRIEDLINMDARSVLSCLPFLESMPATVALDQDEFVLSLIRSWTGEGHSVHAIPEILSWITEARTLIDVEMEATSLRDLPGWQVGDDKISHESCRFFDVIGVRVEAGGREVSGWDQPMLAACHTGLVAFLVTRIDGVAHLLVNCRVEPGFADVVELAPTVQCAPENYEHGDLEPPPFLDEVRSADPARVRFDTVLSEEGGRFFQTSNRYMVVETDQRLVHPDFRWMTLHQLSELLRHSHYVNVQARSLLACAASLATPEAVPT